MFYKKNDLVPKTLHLFRLIMPPQRHLSYYGIAMNDPPDKSIFHEF